MTRPDIDYSLYVCTDRALMRGRAAETGVEAAIAGGATLIQIREKDASSREFYDTAQRVHAVTQKYGVPLIVNDRADIALAVGAEGLHIGQSDLELTVARRLLGPAAIIGVSVQGSVALALEAQKHGADYIGVGEIYPTTSKAVENPPIGVEGLAAVCRAVRIPAVAIGGITADNLLPVLKAGAAGVCVISAIWSRPDFEQAARAFKERRP
jgi:thiamine-phosphate pyrophosphorylase